MKIVKLALLLLSIVYQSKVFGQQLATDLIPKGLKARASAIIRDEQINIDMKNEANIIQSTTKAITILNKSGDHYAELMLFYDKSRSIKDIKGQIYDEFGKQIGKFTLKDFKDYSATDQVSMYDDIRVKHYAPAINIYPYTIVYTYEIKHNQNLFIPYWRPNAAADLAIEKSTYKFTGKPDLKLRIKTQNITSEPNVQELEKAKTYTWSVSNINARKEEPYSPITNKEEILVSIVPETFQYFKKQGTATDWNELGKWMYDDLLKDKQDLPQATKDKVKQLTANASTPKEKAKILYDYLQNKTRYISIQVGIGGLEPYPASYVDRLGYGDCKALVNYMQALLSAADINSLYCVVQAGNGKVSLDQHFANAVDGNHVILCLPFENDTTWLECTSNKHPFGYLGNFTDDRLVLACTPEGGKILKTKEYTAGLNRQIRKAKLNVKADGSLQGEVSTTFGGTQFDNHYSNVFKSPTEQSKELKNYYDIDNITFTNFSYQVSNNNEPELIEKLDIAIKNYIVKNGNNLIFIPNIFNTLRAIPDTKNRINEVYINRGYTDLDEIEFSFDAELAGKIVPLEKTLECPMGKYEMRVFNEGKNIKMIRNIQINQGTYAIEDYQKFYNFMKDVSSNDRIKYTLNLGNN